MTKTTAKDSLRGIFPALMTAFSDAGIRTDAVTALVQKLAANGVDGFYVGGSSGEMVLCSPEERQRLLETVREATGSLPVIAHIGAMSTRDAAALGRHAARCGADAVSSVTPLYYRYRFDEVLHYYQRLAGESGLPLVIYNIPGLTGTAYGYDELCRLLELPGVAGMKFTSSDFFLLGRLADTYPDKVFFNGSDEMLLSGLNAGAAGGIGTTYNFMPDLFAALFRLFSRGKTKEAMDVQQMIRRVIAVVLKYGAIPASKAMIRFYGVDYGVCREPFLPLGEDAVRDLYENAWLPLERFRQEMDPQW